MGLLNFRKKNKKIDSLPKPTCKDNSPDSKKLGISAEGYSPVVNSFMTVSSISDVTSSSLMDEILNELPSPKRSLNSSSESETSSTKNIRQSLNLNSNRSNNNPEKSFNTKEKASTTSTRIMPFSRILPSISSHHMSKGPHSVTKMKVDTICTDSSNSSDESESDSLSIDSLFTTEDPPPSHPISWSDSRFSPGFIAKKQEDTTPLMELISRSCAVGNTPPIGVKDRKATKGGANTSHNETDSSDISRTSGFAIDRMKERHRQEYRRSISYIPSEAESRLIYTQRSNPLTINNPHYSIASPHEYQRINSSAVVNKQVNMPLINNVEFRTNRMSPEKSFSTNTSTLLGNVPFATDLPNKQRHPQYNGSINKHQNRNTSKSNHAISVYNMQQSYLLTSTVPPTVNSSGKNYFVTNKDLAKKGPPQSFFCPTKSKHMGNESKQDSGSSIQVIQEERYTKFSDSLPIHAETTLTLKKDYRRMQQINKNKCHSVPNLQHLQDNGKLEKDLLRNPLETNTAEAKIINNKKKMNQRMKSEKIYSKNIYDVTENQQHYNNKFIYRYSHTPQHIHNHQKKCHHHKRQPERLCSCKCTDKQQNYSNHQVKTREPRKPLLLLTPFEPSNTKNHHGSQTQ